jgi:hypothetical protein
MINPSSFANFAKNSFATLASPPVAGVGPQSATNAQFMPNPILRALQIQILNQATRISPAARNV